jgi:Flp pilus assembly protein TadD
MQGDILRAHARFAEAVAAYDKAVALIPHPTADNWVLFYNRAVALDRDHQWPRAEADLMRALALSPGQPYALNYLGYSLTEQGRDLKRARQMIEQAAAARPDDGAIADSLGWVMLRMGDATGGMKQLERAAELEPNDATINMHLGDAYWAVGRKLDAQFQWRRAMTLNPEPDDQRRLEAKIAEGEKALGIPSAQAAPATPAPKALP